MIAETESSIGSTRLTAATMPKVPATALRASSKGMPAATSAPKATTRMTSVSGTENRPALFRSPMNDSFSALLVLSPNDPT